MKSVTLFVLLLLTTSSVYAQHKSCCAIDPVMAMKQMAADPKFAALHDEPLPYQNQTGASGLQGMMTTFATSGGPAANAYVVKGVDTTRVLFVFHEWWGLNNYIKDEAARLAHDLGVTAIAIDLYDGKVATTREEAQQYVGALTADRAMAIINGAFAHFGANRSYATIGWCMGGMYSLKAAIAGSQGYHVVGAVMYYGMPERDSAALAPLEAPVLGIFAKQDQSITPAIVKEAQKAFRTAKKKITVHMYDAVHAFANPSNPNHDAKASANAYKKTLAFLKTRFKR